MSNQSFQWREFIRSRTGLVLIFFLAVAGFYLIAEHTIHIFGVLPYLLLFLCPLMHLFMHSGHGDSHTQHTDKPIQQVEDHSQHQQEIKP